MFIVPGISPDCSESSAQAPFRQCCDPAVRDGGVSSKGHSQIRVRLAPETKLHLDNRAQTVNLTPRRGRELLFFFVLYMDVFFYLLGFYKILLISTCRIEESSFDMAIK